MSIEGQITDEVAAILKKAEADGVRLVHIDVAGRTLRFFHREPGQWVTVEHVGSYETYDRKDWEDGK